jgi:hypothetical protein
MARNGFSPPAAGGRIVSLAPLPFLFQDSYASYHGATPTARALLLLVDSMRWIRGGRSTGSIYVSEDYSDLDFYAEGSDAPAIGAGAITALSDAGFTVTQFTGKGIAAALALADVVVFDRSHVGYDQGENPDIVDAVMNDGKGMLLMYDTGAIGGFGGNQFGLGAAYAYQMGSVALYGWPGSELLFDRSFGSGEIAVNTFAGRGSIAASSTPGAPAYGLSYPSPYLASWKQANGTTHPRAVGVFTKHGDSGVGDDWT